MRSRGSAAGSGLPVSPVERLVHPEFRRLPGPVVVVGMHRSGTSMVAAMLRRLGVHMGDQFPMPDEDGPIAPDDAIRRSGYGEATSFLAVNELLLFMAGASWDRPQRFLERRERAGYRARALLVMAASTRGSLHRAYIDRMPGRFAGAWGWKDPRTSLTAELWLRLFPRARVLHVHRRDGASARSLHRRALEWWGNSPVAPPAPLSLRLRNALLNPAAGVGALRRKLGLAPPLQVRPDPCLELEWCEKLEQLYRTECERWRVLGDRYLEVDYDRLLREPEGAVKVMAAFTDCRASRAEQAAAAAIVWKGSGVPAASGAGAGSRR